MDTETVCPICASSEQEALAVHALPDMPSRGIVRCKSCRYIYQLTPPRQPSDRYCTKKELFCTRRAELSVDTFPQRLALIEQVSTRGALLDIGCGEGHFLRYAILHGWEISGVESSSAILRAHLHLPRELVRPALSEGLWPAGRFDAVTIWSALEQVHQPADLLSMIAHYCRVDGALIVQILNGDSLYRHHRHSAHSSLVPTMPAQLFSSASLAKFLGRFGFRIERIEQSLPTTRLQHAQVRLPDLFQRDRQGVQNSVLSHTRPRRDGARIENDERLLVIARYAP